MQESIRQPRTAFAVLVGVTIALVIAMLALRLMWGWYVDQKFDRYIAGLQSHGRPIASADLEFAPVPASDDAWPLITQAAAAVTFDSPRNSNIDFRNYPPYEVEWMQMAEESVRKNAPALALMEQAHGRRGANVPHGTTFVRLRGLANTLVDAAIYQHLRGRDADALKLIDQTYHLAAIIATDDAVVPQLIATGIESLANNALQTIAPGLRREARQPAAPQQIQHLIARLLAAEQTRWRSCASSFDRERVTSIEDGQPSLKRVWFTRPRGRLEHLTFLRSCDIGQRAAERGRNEPQIVSILAQEYPEGSVISLEPEADLLMANDDHIFFPYLHTLWFARYLNTRVRVTAESRATVVSLACQLYRLDHGNWPHTLDELVPAYLAVIPADPYHDDGGAIGYTSTPRRPMLYFDAGPDVGPRQNPAYEWQKGPSRKQGVVRQYRDVSRWSVSAPATSSSSATDQTNEPNAPRQ